MRRFRSLLVALVVAAVFATPAAALGTVQPQTWGCLGLELVVGFCIENPLPQLGL